MPTQHLRSEKQRAAVFGYRLMFSPEIQPIKRTLIDQIILTKLAESTNENGESVGKLTILFVNGVKVLTLSLEETKSGVNRLVKQGLAEVKSVRKKNRWVISDKGREKVKTDRHESQRRIDSVTDSLFAKCFDRDECRTAFLECLAELFGRLARQYVEVSFRGVDSSNEVSALDSTDIDSVTQEVLVRFPNLRAEHFLAGVRTFFREDHPDYTWLKWTYCKNYYSLNIVGLGDYSEALSEEVFAGTTVYLDTNVLISALHGSSLNHSAVTQTISKLREIGCDIGVLSVTVDELAEVAKRQGDNLDAVLRQIPSELLPRVSGLVARTEASHRSDASLPSPSEVLSDFENSRELIKNKLQVVVSEDTWFDQERDSEKIKHLAEELRMHYDRTPPVWRHKTQSAANHDALALQFLSEQKRHGHNCMFVTLDGSLPTFRHSIPDTSNGKFRNVMTVDALLPWIGMVSQSDDDVSKAYSSLLSHQMVMMKQAFSINEFRMLAEIGMDCGQLPAEDVERCLLYLREEAKDSDLRSAEDREVLHHKVKSFFSSPDRKYLSEISRLRHELSERDVMVAQLSKENRRGVEQFQEKVDEYASQLKSSKVKQRLTVAATLSLFLAVICFWLANKFGTGANFLQKIGNSWWLFGLLASASALIVRILCRGELWPATKQMLKVFRND